MVGCCFWYIGGCLCGFESLRFLVLIRRVLCCFLILFVKLICKRLIMLLIKLLKRLVSVMIFVDWRVRLSGIKKRWLFLLVMMSISLMLCVMCFILSLFVVVLWLRIWMLVYLSWCLKVCCVRWLSCRMVFLKRFWKRLWSWLSRWRLRFRFRFKMIRCVLVVRSVMICSRWFSFLRVVIGMLSLSLWIWGIDL